MASATGFATLFGCCFRFRHKIGFDCSGYKNNHAFRRGYFYSLSIRRAFIEENAPLLGSSVLRRGAGGRHPPGQVVGVEQMVGFLPQRGSQELPVQGLHVRIFMGEPNVGGGIQLP